MQNAVYIRLFIFILCVIFQRRAICVGNVVGGDDFTVKIAFVDYENYYDIIF